MHLVVAVTVIGTVEAGLELMRTGAKPGDAVFVTGAVGMSAAGLHALLARGAKVERAVELLESRDSEESARLASLIQAHQRPAPSVRAGRLLLKRGTCHALNDVSDGLASEAWEIAEASGLKIVLNEQLLPKSGSMAAYAARVGMDPLEWILGGGEDYVLLGTMAAADAEAMRLVFRQEGLPFFIIGVTEAGKPDVELIRFSSVQPQTGKQQEKRVKVEKRGYNHFK